MMCGDSRRAKMMPTCHSKKPRRRRKPGQVTLDHSSQHRIQCRNPRPSQNQHRQHPIYSWQGPVFLLSCWKRKEHEAKWEFNKRFKWHPGIWLIRCRKHLNSLLCSWYAWIWYSHQVKFCANVSKNCQSTKRKQHVVALFKVFCTSIIFSGPPIDNVPLEKDGAVFLCHLLSGNGGMQLKQFLPKNMSKFNGRNAQRGKNVSKTSIKSALMAASNIICISSFRQDSKFSYRYSLSWSKEVWKSNLQQHAEMKCRKQERRVRGKKIQARAKW